MEVATIFKGYQFNECGVCLNPIVAYSFGTPHKGHFKILVCETPNGWVYGYRYDYGHGGGGGGCSLHGRLFYSTKSEAIVGGAESIKRSYLRSAPTSKCITELDSIIKKESVKQYSIFDYLDE